MTITRTSFYWEWVKRSFSGPYGFTQAVMLLATFAGGIVDYFYPQIGQTTSLLLWIIPLIVFCVTLVVAWILAPYAMYRDAEVAAEARERVLRENAANKDGPQIDWSQRADESERLLAAKDQIMRIANMVPVPRKINPIQAAAGLSLGLQEALLHGRDERDWKTETKSRLRAIVCKRLQKDYENVLRTSRPGLAAKNFLESLARHLAPTDLRAYNPATHS